MRVIVNAILSRYYVTMIIGDSYYIGFITYFVAPWLELAMLKQLGVTLHVRGNLARGRLVAR